jgi:D-alanyl-D-alanine carboxypeptidase/D-alanyl-D-alanine-endopeptidase (penicillin-binding protein 4)
MYFVYFNPGNKIGYPASSVRVSPKNIAVHGICEVTTGPEGSGDNVTIYGSPTGDERLYRGTVPLGKNDFRVRGALPNPAKQCADLFASYLRTHGISVSSNSMQVYSQPDSLRMVLDYYSSDYYTIAQYTNLTSNNIYAEAIFKYLGYAKYGKGSFANGSKVVMDYFREKRLDIGGVKVLDGSGLSPLNKVTADFMCRYLTAIGKEPFFNDFLRSLSKVGENGTAKNLLPNLPAGIAVRVKTGTMEGVKAYAGYIDAANGDRLAFTIISNGHEVSSTVAAEKLNKILQKVVTIY